MTTPIIICADDYALTPGISRAIRDLAGLGRLSATSAMTVSPYWDAEGAELKQFLADLPQPFSAGLHFTLTDFKPLTSLTNLAPEGHFRPLGALLSHAMLRRIPADEVRRELEAQVDRFEAVMGRPPDYLDGHHHVHQLPAIRDVVLDVVRRRLGPAAFVRLCDEPTGAILRRGVAVPRAFLISLLGRVFAARARRIGLRGNAGFRGVRDFTAAEAVARLFDAYLTDPRANMMIMCHPGIDEPAPGIDDEIRDRRPEEYAFLRSDAFAELMARRGVALVAPAAVA